MAISKERHCHREVMAKKQTLLRRKGYTAPRYIVPDLTFTGFPHIMLKSGKHRSSAVRAHEQLRCGLVPDLDRPFRFYIQRGSGKTRCLCIFTTKNKVQRYAAAGSGAALAPALSARTSVEKVPFSTDRKAAGRPAASVFYNFSESSSYSSTAEAFTSRFAKIPFPA